LVVKAFQVPSTPQEVAVLGTTKDQVFVNPHLG